MNREFIYVIKLWATALLVSPIVNIIADHQYTGGLGIWIIIPLLFALFGAIFSAPSAFLLWLVTLVTFRYSRIHILLQKAIWSVVAAGLSFLPFLLVDDDLLSRSEKKEMTIIYGAVIIWGIWIYQLKPYRKAKEEYVLDEGHPVH